MTPLIIAFFFGLAVFMSVWYFGDLISEKQIITERLRFITHSQARQQAPAKQILKFQTARHKVKLFADFSPRYKLIYFALTTVLEALAMLYLKMPPINKILIAAIIPIALYRVIRSIEQRRYNEKVESELPGAIDLIVICLEAGLGVNAAFLRVGNELDDTIIGQEFKKTFHEVSAGIPLEEALKNFSRRMRSPDINSLVSSVIHAQKIGVPIANTFRVQSGTIRDKCRSRLKEKIAKIPVKILIPLVFFIFPELFVVILGPAMIQIMKQFGALT